MNTMNVGSVLMALLCAALTAPAADYYVAEGGTGNYTAGNPGPSPVQAAKLATSDGDVIHVGPGLYSESETVALAQNTTMIGTTGNPDDVVITRIVTGNNDRVIYLAPNAVLRDLTVRGGYTDYQAACVLGYSKASNVHKNFSVSNCIVEGGSAKYKGGASYGGVWRDCVFRNNRVRDPNANETTEGSGGAVWGSTLYNCVITNNMAAVSGGGIAGGQGEPCIAYNCLIGWNRAPYGAGAATLRNRACCQLIGCTVVSNSAVQLTWGQKWGGRGGGAYKSTLTNCVVRGNVATYPSATGGDSKGGGGISDSAAYDCDILDNRTKQATSSEVSGGGDWHVSGGGSEGSYLENCRIIGNYAVAYGGGSMHSTNVNCWVAENNGNEGGGGLGGIFDSCVISNNVARDYHGGAAYNSTTYNCLVINNTSRMGATLFRGYHQGDLIVGNVMHSPDNNSTGSAISPLNSSETCDASAVNCTIVGNSGGEAALCAVHATNCLVVGNSPVDVKWMTLANTCMWVTDSNPSRPDETAAPAINCTRITDPKFVVEPKANECPYSLRMISPCRDQGIYFDWMEDAVDILGNPRVNWGKVDIGAIECYGHLGTGVIVR